MSVEIEWDIGMVITSHMKIYRPDKQRRRCRANLCGCRNSNVGSAESQQRRTQTARDRSIGEVALGEELVEHVFLLGAKGLVESRARACWSRGARCRSQ